MTKFVVASVLASLTIASASPAASPNNPMGIAIGNLLIGDYGAQGKVTGMFDKDGTVALTFPDGTSARQTWVADDKFFCMIRTPAADGKFNYRCERNLIAGKKLGQSWQQVDSEGQTVTIVIKPRP